MAWYASPGGQTELRFTTRGDGVLTGPNVPKALCSDILQQEVLEEHGGKVVLLRKPDGQLAPLPVPVPAPRWLAVHAGGQGGTTQSLKQWCLKWMTRGLQMWWSAGDLAHLYHPGLKGDMVPRYVLNSWARWAGYVQDVMPVHIGLRKGIDRRGHEFHWTRFLPEPTLCTTALLTVLLGQATQCKVPERTSVQYVLSALLKERLAGQAVDLLVPLDKEYATAYCFPGVQPPPALCARLPLDGHLLQAKPLVAQAPGITRLRLTWLVGRLADAGEVTAGKVDLGAFLVALRQDVTISWMLKGFVHQVGRLLEAVSPPECFSVNPLEGVERTWGGAADIDMTFHLVQGLGADSSAGEAATFVEQHVESFHRLRKHKKRDAKNPKAAKMNLRRTTSAFLMRYQMAAKAFLSQCPVISVALDASRVGGKDVLLVAILGTSEAGETKVAWAPPQAGSSAVERLCSQRPVSERFQTGAN